MKRRSSKWLILIIPLIIGSSIGVMISFQSPTYKTYRFLIDHNKRSIDNEKWFTDQSIHLESGLVGRTYSTYNKNLVKDQLLQATELKVYLPSGKSTKSMLSTVFKEVSKYNSSVLLYYKEGLIKDWSPFLYWSIAGLFVTGCFNFFIFKGS